MATVGLMQQQSRPFLISEFQEGPNSKRSGQGMLGRCVSPRKTHRVNIYKCEYIRESSVFPDESSTFVQGPFVQKRLKDTLSASFGSGHARFRLSVSTHETASTGLPEVGVFVGVRGPTDGTFELPHSKQNL
jgi:hypothetical protein